MERRENSIFIRKDKASLQCCQASVRAVRIVHRSESLYLLAHFPDILANKLEDLTEKKG